MESTDPLVKLLDELGDLCGLKLRIFPRLVSLQVQFFLQLCLSQLNILVTSLYPLL